MRDRYFNLGGSKGRVPVSDLPTETILRHLQQGPKIRKGATVTQDDVRLRLEIELIARAYGWPTKRSS